MRIDYLKFNLRDWYQVSGDSFKIKNQKYRRLFKVKNSDDIYQYILQPSLKGEINNQPLDIHFSKNSDWIVSNYYVDSDGTKYYLASNASGQATWLPASAISIPENGGVINSLYLLLSQGLTSLRKVVLA